MEHYASVDAIYLESPYCSIPILVEARLQRGLPKAQINGLSLARSQSTMDRIRNALHASEIQLPYMGLSVSLAPADVKKWGAYFDFSIAISIILALSPGISKKSLLNQVLLDHKKTLFLGELSLSGDLRPVPYLYSFLCTAEKQGFQRVLLPVEQYSLAKLVDGLDVVPVAHLRDVLSPRYTRGVESKPRSSSVQIQYKRTDPSLSHLKLSEKVIRGLALAATGWHSLLLLGPPGSGKTSLAQALVKLLPVPNSEETLDILRLKSDLSEFFKGPEQTPPSLSVDNSSAKCGLQDTEPIHIELSRPMRSPHHSVTRRALIGGGTPIEEGELTRAHRGVLLLDELGEFSRESLQSLREAMEARQVHLSRSGFYATLPAHFLLCATSNPCPCGDLQRRYVSCRCSDATLQNYTNKFMGALRDRIDIEIWVDRKDTLALDSRDTQIGKGSIHKMKAQAKNRGVSAMEQIQVQAAADRIIKIQGAIEGAYEMQRQRFAKSRWNFNSDIAAKDIETYIPLKSKKAQFAWREIESSPKISYRALAGVRRLARSLADLDGSENIREEDLFEAVSYRCLESIWSSA